MLDKKEQKLITELRNNGRQKISKIAKKSGFPKSTFFNVLRRMEKNKTIQHKSLVSFEKIGFSTRILVALQTGPSARGPLALYLSNNPNVNNLHLVNSGFDVHFEAVFKNQKHAQDFMDELTSKFLISKKCVFNIIETIQTEEFLTNEIHFR